MKNTNIATALVALIVVILGAYLFLSSNGLSSFDRSPSLVREIGATDHVWLVDAKAGNRTFIGNEADAEAALLALNVGDEDLLGRNALQILIARSRELSRPDLRAIKVSSTSPEWLNPPDGYVADIVAGDLTAPRVLGLDPAGRLVVSEHTQRGRLIAYTKNPDGSMTPRVILGEGTKYKLHNPHGFVFVNGRVIVASEHTLDSWPYDAKSGLVTGASKRLRTFPAIQERFAGQGHRTRTLVMGSDGFLYVSVGSSCDHCIPGKEENALIWRMKPDGSNAQRFATGLRNTVFFIEDRVRQRWLGNDMGRDDLGEDLPPDELNVLGAGKDYGWPLCYGDRIPAPDTPTPERCVTTEPMHYGYKAHAAPLGLRFIPPAFSEALAGNLLVAFHGSTLRTESVAGYEIDRLIFDDDGKVAGQEPFITGFIKDVSIPAGRPVDMLFAADGTLFITDDHAGVIHRIRKP